MLGYVQATRAAGKNDLSWFSHVSKTPTGPEDPSEVKPLRVCGLAAYLEKQDSLWSPSTS